MLEECEVAAKGRTKTPSLGLGHQVGGFFLNAVQARSQLPQFGGYRRPLDFDEAGFAPLEGYPGQPFPGDCLDRGIFMHG